MNDSSDDLESVAAPAEQHTRSKGTGKAEELVHELTGKLMDELVLALSLR